MGAALPGINLVGQWLLRKHHPEQGSYGIGDMTYAGQQSGQWPEIDQGRLEMADGTMIHLRHCCSYSLLCMEYH